MVTLTILLAILLAYSSSARINGFWSPSNTAPHNTALQWLCHMREKSKAIAQQLVSPVARPSDVAGESFHPAAGVASARLPAHIQHALFSRVPRILSLHQLISPTQSRLPPSLIRPYYPARSLRRLRQALLPGVSHIRRALRHGFWSLAHGIRRTVRYLRMTGSHILHRE